MLTQTSQKFLKQIFARATIGKFPSPFLYSTNTVVKLMEKHQNHRTVAELPVNEQNLSKSFLIISERFSCYLQIIYFTWLSSVTFSQKYNFLALISVTKFTLHYSPPRHM